MSSTETLVIKERYIVLKGLGKGAFGVALLVKDIKDDSLHKVLKLIELKDTMKPSEIISFSEEAIRLCKLNHPNIIKYFDSFSVENSYYAIVTEYCEGGDLSDKLESLKNINYKLTNQEIVKWLLQIASALEYLHSNNVIHRDLKTKNIFLTNNDLKLGDFGLAVEVPKTDAGTRSIGGTLAYLSPECYTGTLMTAKSDCWAFGIVIYEMCAYDLPFNTVDAILNNNPLDIPTMYHSYIKQTIFGLLDKNPQKRFTINQVKEIMANNMDEQRRDQLLETISKLNTKRAEKFESTKKTRSEKTEKRMKTIHEYTETVSSICEIQ